MKRIVLFVFAALMWIVQTEAQVILPTPQSVTTKQGELRIDFSKATVFSTDREASFLALFSDLFRANHHDIKFSKREKANICFILNPSLHAEGYQLEINKKNIVIQSAGDAGFIYALQTIRQCILDVHGTVATLPCVHITDAPQMGWRSFMLDSGRQYQRVETIKKYIDMASLLKMNCFHWHLTEGLGWRIEIKKYPKLTEIGSCVGTDKEQQGYYTQDEISDIVAYAAARNIEIMPEIDVPGHAEAALASYPELSCFGAPIEIPKTGFTQQIFCAGKDQTLQFFYDVLDEVCQLFPCQYIHLGGDEAPKGNWNKCPDCQHRIDSLHLKDSHALQMWLSAQLADYLKEKNRKAVFWDDLVADVSYPLPSNAVVEWWNYRAFKNERLKQALQLGLPVICSTNQYNYLNFPVTPWAGYDKNRTATFEDCYLRNPSYPAMQSGNPLLLGMNCCLWTDYVVTEDMIDERLFPRIFAIAEMMWHQGSLYPLEEFKSRIKEKQIWFEALGFQFGGHTSF